MTRHPDTDAFEHIEGYAVGRCPECEFGNRITWPPDDPAEVQIRCHGCKRWLTVTVGSEVVEVAEE